MLQNQKTPLAPFLLIGFGVVILVIVIVWGLSTTLSPLTTSGAATPDTNQIIRTSLDQAKQAFESKSATFVDVRDADVFTQSHIAGAINIPLIQIESSDSSLSKSQWIILYCT